MRRCALVFVALPVAAMALAQGPVVWVASPWEQVLKSTEPPAAPSHSISLSAAANEYEPCRLIVRAGAEPLADVSLKLSSLRNSKGIIPLPNLTAYREYYLDVFKPSYASHAPTGWYPDALIPFVDPVTGQDLTGAKYDAAPYTIEANSNQGYWVDVYVPKGTAAGTYRGEFIVTSANKPIQRLPVALTVRGFALPDTIALQSNFGGLGIWKKLALDPGSQSGSEVRDLYTDAFLAHRCVLSDLGNIWPKISDDGTVDDSQSGERLRRMIEEKHVNALSLPFPWASGPEKCKTYLHALAGYLRQKGWLDLAYIYLEDEPNNAEQYETVRQQAALIKEADPGIHRLCTEQTLTSDPKWGDLYGAVDIWCPLWYLHDEKTGRERQALGEKLWSYTALCQGNNVPFWEIDFAPVMFRAPFWISWHYDMKGFLYWSSTYWPYDDVWNKPFFRDAYWGEGMLVYPGSEAGIKGPVPSIRLKLVREALEDVEYMTLAAKQGHKMHVDAIVDKLARSFTDWERDPAAYLQAREEIARLVR